MIRQKSFEEISQSIRNNINDRLPQVDTKPGTWTSDVIVSPISDEIAATYADMKVMEINQSILTASGDDLDRLCKNYFVNRNGATQATGIVRFYIENSNRDDTEVLPDSIYIPMNFVVSTMETTSVPYKEFITTESVFISKNNITSLPIDYLNNYRYIDVNVAASEYGSASNLSSGTITVLSSELQGIDSCINLSATIGGQDKEPDISLRFRAMLAILGASICTKNGYLKWIIQQPYVEDALVIGAADSIMFRDGGYLNAAKEYVYGRGGMVDIWVKGQQNVEGVLNVSINTSYLSSDDLDIVFPNQPVTNIVSIQSTASGHYYDNAGDYEVEYGVSSDNIEHTAYYKDILWDFSITDTFPDTNMYAIDIDDATEIELLKRRMDEELQEAVNYLYNVNHSINWALVTYEDISAYDVPPLFQKVYYNGVPYKIIAVDNRLNGRTFVKRNNKIYLRYYNEPDYVLIKNSYLGERFESQINGDLGNSIYATDRIHWLKDNILQDGDTLNIIYNYNQLISSLQNSINDLKILTADILIREAYAVPIEILMKTYCNEYSNSTILRNTIITKINTLVTSVVRMGGVIDNSMLAALARDTYGITQVDLTSVTLSKKNQLAVPLIELAKNEYFVLENVDVEITSVSQVSN